MEFDFVAFLQSNWQDILQFALLGIIAIVQVVKYGKVSKGVKQEMSYRLQNYRKGISDEDKGGQTFDRIVPEYAYDETRTSFTL